MSELTIDVLKKIVDKVPGDYTVEFEDEKISDNFEINVSSQKIIFKKY